MHGPRAARAALTPRRDPHFPSSARVGPDIPFAEPGCDRRPLVSRVMLGLSCGPAYGGRDVHLSKISRQSS